MNKKVFVVIIISIILGFMIFKILNSNSPHVDKIVRPNISQSEKSPSPKPTLPPLNQNSSLEEELDKLTPPDSTNDFEKLRQEVKEI